MLIASHTRPVESTRAQIVGAARQLIQTRSYLGFSFQDLADQVGIRKASLYHHFPTKEALGIEVLREVGQSFREWAAEPRAADVALDAYFRMCRQVMKAGAAVCPAGALAPGWDCINEDLRQTVRELRSAQVMWLTGVLGALLHNAKPSVSASALAAYVFAACQGALLSARMTGQIEDFDEAIVYIKQSIPY
ncbi:TetR/AcrR family transcriptional regulator|uniref:TetR/AcrR family transcriptional regulator n=1 Tax=Stenotrophomonas sp. SbOxS2 TaxID=2723885 RepID=UPI0015D103D4|nr:TetR/AcrR family transcriptional regulator [Stenotrophomonas sp. SbOxS2]NYT99465.1 TetR/AcrR family transcriptional regulator [Stenotrophomonas sp. SbOxS2]